MEFIRELLEASKKKAKVSKTAARNVYHRDYVKTKQKPYRKYHPEERHIHEGWDDEAGYDREDPKHPDFAERRAETADYDRDAKRDDGAMRDYQSQPPEDTEQLGQHLTDLVGDIADYDRMNTNGASQEQPEEEAPEQSQGSPRPQQFSSFLRNFSGIVLPENNEWNANYALAGNQIPQGRGSIYLKRGFQKVGGPFSNEQQALAAYKNMPNGAGVKIVNASQENEEGDMSQNRDLSSVKKSASDHIKQIVNLAKQMGPNALQELEQMVAKHCGDKANRIMSVLTQAAEKMGVQLQ